MRGFALRNARMQERTRLRRAAQEALPPSTALDGEMLLAMLAGGAAGVRYNLLTRALVWRGLRGLGYAAVDLALVWKTSAEEVDRSSTSTLLDASDRAGEIERELDALFQETPEPDRFVEPALRR